MRTSGCGNCIFWDQLETETGFCRRYAPRAVIHQINHFAGDGPTSLLFPVTSRDCWCGEMIEYPSDAAPEPISEGVRS